jgi:hypothetical protein
MTDNKPPAKPILEKPDGPKPKTPPVKKPVLKNHGGPPATKADHAAFRRTDKTVIKRMRAKH